MIRASRVTANARAKLDKPVHILYDCKPTVCSCISNRENRTIHNVIYSVIGVFHSPICPSTGIVCCV